ncbi:MAG: oligosaccharide flippase family protein [Flavobacteriaceae bacterium]
MKNKSLLVPFAEVLSKVISFVNILLFVRILSVQDYADYSYIVAIVMWSSVLMDGGINNLIYNKSLKKETSGIDTLFTSRLFLSIIVILFVSFLFITKRKELAIAGILFSLITYFSSTSALVKMLSRGLGFVKADIISILSEPFIRFILLSIIYTTSKYFDYTLSQVLFIYLIAGGVAFLINKHYLSIYFSLKLRFASIKTISKNIAASLKQSKYYLLYYVMIVGLGRIDILFLDEYSGKHELAVFSSALNMYQVAQLFFISIITSQFLKLYKNKYLYLKFLVPLLVLTVLLTNISSSYIFKYLFPEPYIKGQFVLNILIIAILPAIVNYYYITKNNYENKVKINFLLLLVVFLIKTVIYFILKPTDLQTYSYIYLTSEGLLLTLFIIKILYENTTNKQVS